GRGHRPGSGAGPHGRDPDRIGAEGEPGDGRVVGRLRPCDQAGVQPRRGLVGEVPDRPLAPGRGAFGLLEDPRDRFGSTGGEDPPGAAEGDRPSRADVVEAGPDPAHVGPPVRPVRAPDSRAATRPACPVAATSWTRTTAAPAAAAIAATAAPAASRSR